MEENLFVIADPSSLRLTTPLTLRPFVHQHSPVVFTTSGFHQPKYQQGHLKYQKMSQIPSMCTWLTTLSYGKKVVHTFFQVPSSTRAQSHPDQQGDHHDQKQIRLRCNQNPVDPHLVQERHRYHLVQERHSMLALATQRGLQVLCSPHQRPTPQFVASQLSRHLWFSWTRAVTIFLQSRRKVHSHHQICWLPFPPAFRPRGRFRVLRRISLRRRRQLWMKSWCRRNRT